MPILPISGLLPVASAQGTDEHAVDQGGITKRESNAQIASYLISAIPPTTLQNAYNSGPNIGLSNSIPLKIDSFEQSITNSVSVNNPGAFYNINDILEFNQGTVSIRPARVIVIAIGPGGSIDAALMIEPGTYTVAPPLSGATTINTMGVGLGATFDITLQTSNTVYLSNANQFRGNVVFGGETNGYTGSPLATASFYSPSSYFGASLFVQPASTQALTYAVSIGAENGTIAFNNDTKRWNTIIDGVVKEIPILSDIPVFPSSSNSVLYNNNSSVLSVSPNFQFNDSTNVFTVNGSIGINSTGNSITYYDSGVPTTIDSPFNASIDSHFSAFSLSSFDDTTGGLASLFLQGSRGTVASPNPSQNGDTIGAILPTGMNQSLQPSIGSFLAFGVYGVPTTTACPTNIILFTENIDTGSFSFLDINPDGSVELGGVDPANINGNLGISFSQSINLFTPLLTLNGNNINQLNVVTLTTGSTTLSDSNIFSTNLSVLGADTTLFIPNSEIYNVGTAFNLIRGSTNNASISADTSVSINGIANSIFTISDTNAQATIVKTGTPNSWTVFESNSSFVPSGSGSIFTQTGIFTLQGTSAKTIINSTGSGSLTIPANTLIVGDSFVLTLAGTYRTNLTSPNDQIAISLEAPGIVLSSTPTFIVSLNGSLVSYKIQITLTVVSIGGPGVAAIRAITNVGNFASNASTQSNFYSSNGTTFDTTVDLNLNLYGQWNNSGANNILNSFLLNLVKN